MQSSFIKLGGRKILEIIHEKTDTRDGEDSKQRYLHLTASILVVEVVG